MPPQIIQNYVVPLAAHRVLLYSLLSTVAVAAVIANALRMHSNFYAVTVSLSKSNGTVMVLSNFGFLVALLLGRVLQRVFFGSLRTAEVERLYDRMWFFVTESLLAFTIFRDEFDLPFILMFGQLLFAKCFHWLLADRIEWMDQRPYPGPPLLFHVRANALMTILWATDIIMFALAVENIVSTGVGGMVLFASEYAILLASLLNCATKYTISVYELRRASQRGGENAPPWEDKSMYIFYVELLTDFLKLVVYLAFFMLVMTFYGLPLNIIRDVYITASSFVRRFRDLIRYRTATRNMDQRYPNATEEELNAMSDKTCIICREEMVPRNPQDAANGQQEPNQPAPPPPSDGPNTTPKKLPCGHVFHFHCLRSWLERQQSCPTCRRTVLESNQAPTPTPAQPGAPVPNGNPQFPPANQGLANLRQPIPGPGQGGNFGGWLNRFIGIAGGPPMLPGQVVGAQPLPAVIPAGPPGQNGHQHHQWWAPPQPAPPPAYQPPPVVFQGFHGPDGVWNPWNHQLPGATPQPPARQASETSTPTPTPTPTVPAVSENHESNGVVPGDSGESEPRGEAEALNPREAAALAALRRSSKAPVTDSSQDEPPRAGSSVPTKTADISERETGPSRPDVPALIPLFNPATTSTTRQHPPLLHNTSLAGSSNLSHLNSAASLPSNIPPHVAHALQSQLTRIDQLVVNSIDERLRSMESLQSAMTRCIEELVRIRSMLPQVDASLDPQLSLQEQNGHVTQNLPQDSGSQTE